jgi:hypothetical protein
MVLLMTACAIVRTAVWCTRGVLEDLPVLLHSWIGRKRDGTSERRPHQTTRRSNKNQHIILHPTHFLPAFHSGRRTEHLVVLNPMNHHRHGKATWRLGQMESHTTGMRNPGFGGPLTHHVNSSEASMDYWMSNTSSHSSSSDWEIPSMPEVLQVPPPSPQLTIEISPDHDRKPSGVPSFVESDANSSVASMDYWMSNTSSHSSSSDWEIPSMPELLQVSPPSSQLTIEISPGVHVRLRGASETWKAIENDYYMPAECICCESTIFCIQNADFVLCPDCRVVSRMDGVSSRRMGGVGLGFKYEDLARWQDAILKEQLSRHPQAQF